MKNHWLDRAKERLESQPGKAIDAPFERLRAQGLIDENGEVTGHLHRWDAFLAVTHVKRPVGAKRIEVFRCLKPVFGMPGDATIDISRESMVTYLNDGRKIITACRDDRLDMWKEGHNIHLSASGNILCDCADDIEDNVGSLPELTQPSSQR